MTHRDPFIVVVLTIVTFGLYGLYWQYKTTEELGETFREDVYPALELVLSLATMGLFSVYVSYRNAGLAHKQILLSGVAHEDKAVAMLVLGVGTFWTFFSWPFIAALLQLDYNRLAPERHALEAFGTPT